jgi:hypothetical protein
MLSPVPFPVSFFWQPSGTSGGGGWRYVKIEFVVCVGGLYGNDYSHNDNAHRFGLLTSVSGFLPAARQTGPNAPLVVTESSKYSDSHAGWKAIQDQAAWAPMTTDSDPWIKIDFGGTLTEKIIGLRVLSANVGSTIRIKTSATGAFSGEETLVKEWTGLTWAGGLIPVDLQV